MQCTTTYHGSNDNSKKIKIKTKQKQKTLKKNTVVAAPQSYRKIAERGKIDTP